MRGAPIRLGYAMTWTLTGIIEKVFGWLHIPEVFVGPAVMVAAAAVILGFILFTVLYLIYGLRKIMGWIQSRIGPNRVGPYGLAQTMADAVKLLAKQDIIPAGVDKWVFVIAPIVVFVPAYMVYLVIPFGKGNGWIAQDLNIGVLYIAAVTTIPILGIIMAGWASNSKWSLLGAFRAAAQAVSYEVPLVLAMIPPVMLAGSLSIACSVSSSVSRSGSTPVAFTIAAKRSAKSGSPRSAAVMWGCWAAAESSSLSSRVSSLSSRMALPDAFPSPASRVPPNSSKTTIKMMINSGQPIEPMTSSSFRNARGFHAMRTGTPGPNSSGCRLLV